MKTAIIVVLVLIGAIGLFFVVSSPDNSSDAEASITMASINTDITTGAQLVDVRTPEEFSDGYIEGAVNLPLDSIKAGQYPSVSKDSTVYVYCRSGNRSAEAANILKNAGFTDVIDLGGINDVAAIGGKTVK
jgi:rhodanese-related sulfurtransferase